MIATNARTPSTHRRPRGVETSSFALAALAVAATLVCATPPASGAVDSRASRYYEDALTRYEKKDVAGAIIQLKNALQIDKSMLPVQVLLGKALLANSEVVAAEAAFTEALRLGVSRAEIVVPLAQSVIAQGRPRQVVEQDRFALAGLPPGVQQPLRLLRASALSDLGDPQGALKEVDEARALDARSPDSWLAEVPIRIRAGQLRAAVSAADRAQTLAPRSAEVLYLRGSVAHVQGDIGTALGYYDRALALDPDHTEALVARAGLLMDLGRSDEAARDVGRIAQKYPGDPRGQYLKALAADRRGDVGAAQAALREVTALLDPVPFEFLRYRVQILMLGGLAHYGLNEPEKARPFLEAVQRAQPGSPASKLLARIYLAGNDTDRAIESLDAYLGAQPRDAQALRLLASAHMSKGRYARAAKLMQDALAAGDQPALRTLLGLSLIGGGRFGDAITELESAWRKDPTQVQAGAALAQLYVQSGQGAKAVTIAEALLTGQPKSPVAHNLLGSARVVMGDPVGARAAFEKAVKLDSRFIPARINLARLDAAGKSYDAAVTRLNEVLRVDERNVEALGELGRIAELRQQTDGALRWYEKADDASRRDDLGPGLALVEFLLRHDRLDAALEATRRLTGKAPEAVPVLIMVARVDLARGNPLSARASLNRAAGLIGFDAPLLVRVALLQAQAGDPSAASHSLDKALSERPDYVPAAALMADLAMRRGDLARVEQLARRIATTNPRLGIGPALLGDAALAKGQTAAAVDFYRRAHQVDPSSDSLLRLFGGLATTNLPAAFQLAERWVKEHPTDIPVRRMIAEAHARAGQREAARSAYEGLLRVSPDDAEALNNLANLQIEAGDFRQALATAEKALARRPDVAAITGTTGWAAFKAGQADRALQLLRDARLRDPNNLDTRYFLATVLASTGRVVEAQQELHAALNDGRSFVNRRAAEQLVATLK